MLKLETTGQPEQLPQTASGQNNEPGFERLAKRLYPHNSQKRAQSFLRLKDYYQKASGADVLVIHSPGGWGNTSWPGIQHWEKSIVTGVTLTLEKLGYNNIMVQYFRSGDGIMRHLRDFPKEMRFFLTGANYRADVMMEELSYLREKLPSLKIVLVGASQGAAFDNAAMMRLKTNDNIYSIELGTFFPHVKHRKLTA
ncbi:MAG: hypothetical protein PHE50_08495, partial [Dehalococcoidales bacterium]|nr:hypothetical protein [Dehalococcoidales bacterium]